jgi:nucleotide-binding universal stress UspA family protein
VNSAIEPVEPLDRPLIERAIFVLTSPATGQQLLNVLPDLRGIGVSEATILHFVGAARGPAEPMPQLANWVRHFESSLTRVELALKRGDPARWIHELARLRDVHLVVLPGAYEGVIQSLERVTSPLRQLGIPLLVLPAETSDDPLFDRVVLAARSVETVDLLVPDLRSSLGPHALSALHVAAFGRPTRSRRADVEVEIVPTEGGIADTILRHAARRRATLVVVLAGEGTADPGGTGVSVVRPLVADSIRPILIWPDPGSPPAATEARGVL